MRIKGRDGVAAPWSRSPRATPRGVGRLVPAALAAMSLAGAGLANEVQQQAELCVGCHGEGLPSDPSLPIIAGQEFYYLYVQLKDYKAGRRASPIMGGIVQQYEREQLRALAEYFAGKPWPASGYSAPDAAAAQAQSGLIAGQCVQCHLGGYEGNSRVPRLAGQQPAYLEQTLLDFKHKVRLNSPAKNSLLADYSESDISAMAKFLGGL